MAEAFQAFLGKEDEIYGNFRKATEELGKTLGTEIDPGTRPQGAFLIA